MKMKWKSQWRQQKTVNNYKYNIGIKNRINNKNKLL